MKKTDFERIHLYMAYALALSIPLSWFIWLKVLILWIISGIFSFSFKQLRSSRYKTFAILSLIYLLLFVIGLIYSQDKTDGLRLIGLKIYILLVPLIILGNEKIYRQNLWHILSFYILGTVLAVIIMFAASFIHSLWFHNGHLVFDIRIDKSLSLAESFYHKGLYFFYIGLSVLKHPLYMSAEIVFALFALLFMYKNKSRFSLFSWEQKLYSKPVYVLLFLLFSLTVILLSSRTNLITLFIFYFFATLTSKLRPKLVYLTIVTILSLVVTLYNPRSYFLLKYTEHYKELKWQKKYVVFSRVYFWESAWDIAKKRLLFGTGTGDLQWHLFNKYAHLGMLKYLDASYNSHNQYLEAFARLGIFGLLSLLSLLVYPFFIALKHKKYLLLMFLLIISVDFMFEVVLSRVDGIIFFSFFIPILFYDKFCVHT